ncbi:MAG: dynamin family protein [Chloroflexi bacterium]|nr:dynamin family protein [Chloroflexota bacterium]
MRDAILTNEQTLLVDDEKQSLTNILLQLSEMNLPKDSLDSLQKATRQLDELFLVVVVGEFNAGKSALVNAILGEKVLAEGVTPTTTRVTLIRWGEEKSERIVDEGYALVSYPLPFLKAVNIVDSPGTNAIIREHERLTDEFVPRSDLVLFVTSADRPLTESERQFLQRILDWGKKVVFVLNKADIFETPSALQEAEEYVRKHAAVALGEQPVLFPVSAKLAQRAASETNEAERLRLRSASGLDQLEAYIFTRLDDTTRLKIKLNNPLGVADRLIEQAENLVQVQSDDLKEDKTTVDSLENSISSYEHEVGIERSPRMAEVENILHKLEIRGVDFFDRTIRLTNIHHLIHGDQIRAAFEKEVLTDVTAQINEQVQRTIDWLVEKDMRQWQQVMTYLHRRQTANLDHIVGITGSKSSSIRRQELVDKVGRSVTSIVESYDRVKEASQLAVHVETAVAQTALFEIGAAGLGTLVSTALLSSTLDITGVIAAGTLAIVGLFVIPYKRKQAEDNFRKKIVTLRANLLEVLSTTFVKESNNSVARLRDNVAPYTRYVHAEHDRIEKASSLLAEMRRSVSSLRARIDLAVK